MAKWKPKEGDKFYYISTITNRVLVDYHDPFHCGLFKHNCFRTKTQAKQALKLIKKILREADNV